MKKPSAVREDILRFIEDELVLVYRQGWNDALAAAAKQSLELNKEEST
jgi:hypothetical protein